MAKKFTTDEVAAAMDDITKVRNVVTVGAIGTGKTCGMDCLGARCGLTSEDKIGEARFALARQDEREKGCTLKTNITSMLVDDLLLHAIDTPGHAEYSAELSAAMPLADGALVVVDGSGAGMASHTNRQIRELVGWVVEPIIFCNKIDIAILVMQKQADEIADDLNMVVDAVMLALEMSPSPIGQKPALDASKGNILFGSLGQGWGFSIPQMAAVYATKFGMDLEKMSQRLWGEHYFSPKTKKWTGSGGEGAVRGLVQFILSPIVTVSKACIDGDLAKVEKMAAGLKVNLAAADKALEGKLLFRRFMQLWMPAGEAISTAVKKFIPNPKDAQLKRFTVLASGPADDPSSLDIKNCNKDGPVVAQVVKMTPQPGNLTRFFCIGRVYSGTFSTDKCKLMEEDYLPPHAAPAVEESAPAGEEGAEGGEGEAGGEGGGEGGEGAAAAKESSKEKKASSKIQETRAQSVLVCATKLFNAVKKIPAGNLCAFGGLDQLVLKRCSLAATDNHFPLRPPQFSVAPVVRMSVQPTNVKDLPKMVDGLRRLTKSCPLVQVQSEDTGGHIVAGCGEEHMRVLQRDLKDLYLAGTDLTWGAPRVSYREVVTGNSSQTCLAKSPNKHNRLFMVAEPIAEECVRAIEANRIWPTQDLKKRSKILEKEFDWDKTDTLKIWGFGPAPEEAGGAWGPNIIVDQTKGIQYLNEIKESVNSGLLWAAKLGPLCEEKMRGIRYNLLDVKLHTDSIHRGMGQIQPPCRRCLFACMMTASCRLSEPVFMASIEAPALAQPGITAALGACRGELNETEEAAGRVNVSAFIPIAETIGKTPFATVLTQKTNGQASVNYAFDHWQTMEADPLAFDKNNKPLSKAAEIIIDIRQHKGLKLEPPDLLDYLDKL